MESISAKAGSLLVFPAATRDGKLDTNKAANTVEKRNMEERNTASF
jgi:hypothetical protein